MALIVKLFFHPILSLTDYPSISVNDFIVTVAASFDINTGSAKREAEAAAQSQSISRSFLLASNLIGVTFSNSSGQSIRVTDNNNHPADITYFTFCSNVSANTVDCRAPKNL